MAAYCTPADVRAALTPGGVSDDDQTAASLPDWQIADAIDEAESIVNIYTGDYSIVPVEVVDQDPDDPNNVPPYTVAPSPIRRWTRDIAAYLATLTFRKGKDLTPDDPIRLRFAIVMALLADVRSNATILPLPPAEGTSGDDVEIFNLYEGTLFGPEDFNLTRSGQDVQRIWSAKTADT